MCAEYFHAQSDSLTSPRRSVGVLGAQEIPSDVVNAGSRGQRISLVAFRSRHFVFGSPAHQPLINIFGCHMQPRFPKLFPRRESVTAQSIALFFLRDILGDGFAHYPVRRVERQTV